MSFSHPQIPAFVGSFKEVIACAVAGTPCPPRTLYKAQPYTSAQDFHERVVEPILIRALDDLLELKQPPMCQPDFYSTAPREGVLTARLTMRAQSLKFAAKLNDAPGPDWLKGEACSWSSDPTMLPPPWNPNAIVAMVDEYLRDTLSLMGP